MNFDTLSSKLIIFSLPFWLLTVLLFIRLNFFTTYEEVGFEDAIIENIQVVLFAATSIIAGLVGREYWKQNILLSFIFILFALAMFVITMEEISWGQRVLNFATPEQINPKNVQGEANLHNLEQFHYKVYLFNLAAGFYGTFSWMFNPLISKIKQLAVFSKALTIPWFISSFFPALFINNYYFSFMPQDFEAVELLFALGLLIFSAYNYQVINKNHS